MSALSSLRSLLTVENIGRTLDTAIGILSPEIAAQRTKARMQTGVAKRFYDGATKGRRGDGWRKVDAGPKEGLAQLKTLRDRSRDFSRNNGYAKKAVGGIVANTVGTGIVCQYRAEKGKRKVEAANRLWKKWAESVDCDFNGQLTLAGLQELALRTIVESGEVFIRRRFLDAKNSVGKVPLQLQVLEPEFIDDSKDSVSIAASGNQTIAGIEFDSQGRRAFYHMRKSHPTLGGQLESVRVPADEVIHLYRIDRPGQIRGIPWGAAVMLNLWDLDGYEDAELTRRKIAACFAGFISSSPDEEAMINGAPEDTQPPLVDRLEPGILEYLPEGKQITFATPPNVTGYDEYAVSILHKIGAGYEVPYSVLTGDYRQVNFSSGRMGWLEFQRLIDSWRWNLLIPRGLDKIRDWFEFAAALMGQDYSQLEHTWTAPRREMIDPLKEITATQLSLKLGLQSPQDAIKEAGNDPEEVMDEIQEWNKELDRRGIVLDSDPRQDPKRLTAENILKTAKLGAQKVAQSQKSE